MMLVLGYGGFKSTEYWAMLAECTPFFVRFVVPAFVLYGASSVLTERCQYRTAGIWLYMAGFLLMAPGMAVMGAYGPAHVAADAGFPAWPLLFLVVVVKAVVLDVGDSRRKRAAAAGACGHPASRDPASRL